jgi:hypothetical protein
MKNKVINIFLKLVDCISNLMQFECHLLFHQESSKLYNNFNCLNLIVSDEILNGTQII